MGEEEIKGLSLFDLQCPPRKLLPEQYLDDGELVDSIISMPVELMKVLFRDEFQCPICLGTLDKTSTVSACLHRFCAECLHRSLRSDLGPKAHHECPACRVKIASKRASKADKSFDSLIEIFTSSGKILKNGEELKNSGKKDVHKDLLDIIKSDSQLDLEYYRRVHKEKVEQFKDTSLKYRAEEKRKPSNMSGADHFSPSAKKQKSFPPPHQGNNDADATINLSIFPCPQWIQSNTDSATLINSNNPALREGDVQLKKPYLKVPYIFRIIDLKCFLKRKYLLTEDQFSQLQVTIQEDATSQLILDDDLLLKDVASRFWDGVSEFSLHFRLFSPSTPTTTKLDE